uniref:Ctr_126_N conopeptide n=1 Tax=Conus tribblei TaxID=101761 RepID=A0A0C9S5V9_CONTD
MSASGRLLFVCLTLGLVFALLGNPIPDAGDAARDAGPDGGSLERSETIEGRQATLSESNTRNCPEPTCPEPPAPNPPDYTNCENSVC